jgi:hypothetical protein
MIFLPFVYKINAKLNGIYKEVVHKVTDFMDRHYIVSYADISVNHLLLQDFMGSVAYSNFIRTKGFLLHFFFWGGGGVRRAEIFC